MDEEGDRDFSKSIVFGFFDQAKETFDQMEKEIQNKDLEKLSSLGHFLKGSSATLGFNKVRDECEKIQHYGHNKDATGETDIKDNEACLRLINESVAEATKQHATVKKLMDSFYAES
ncbi:uncharacterized protein HMPREF1541_02466 [Cyphellophora europaea CBS 101466]|uniref:HPt domain-containing protein n=1 Tax=Cyphellophora europaea (strain CBS 101466) TaxID=1220924 RepID=W2S3P9_CYPE1|nr:uncharacterized protein HMPREF1541_02466 [Cyphellophora europaea CBS 101466]ETN43307.1 hypothetical protein HMPREF1541_02466 [Cyphellophora europaea CBS 101466]